MECEEGVGVNLFTVVVSKQQVGSRLSLASTHRLMKNVRKQSLKCLKVTQVLFFTCKHVILLCISFFEGFDIIHCEFTPCSSTKSVKKIEKCVYF